MGHRVETYSLAELNKLNPPGSVIPALFWVIPLGNWNWFDLDDLWNLFTIPYDAKFNFCKTLGLLLVKNRFHENDEINANLSGITGKLEDLMPEGINTIYHESYLRHDNSKSNKFLILSGNYPQPGWGLFITVENYRSAVKSLELFLEKSYSEIIDVFEKTHLDYIKWSNKQNDKPKKENISDFEKRLRTLNAILPTCNELQKDLKNNNYNLFHYEILNKFISENPHDDFYQTLTKIKEIFNFEMIFSIMIMRSIEKENITKNEINNLIYSFLNMHDVNNNNLFKTEDIKFSTCKRIIGSYLLKYKEYLNVDNNDVANFYENYYHTNISEKIIKFSEQLNLLNSIFGEINFNVINLENRNDENLRTWLNEKEKLRIAFQNSLENILAYYNKNSFKFLFDLENHLTQNKEFSVKSLSWDPPRMVGWKLLASGLEIENYDIQDYLKKVIPNITKYINNSDSEETIDGNSFTDYIHYYSINKSNLTTRMACKEILSEVLRASDIRKIMNKQNITDNSEDKIELILNGFGWPYVENEKMPLSNCIEIKGDEVILKPTLTGNQIRIALENFCKDLIDVLILKIPFNIVDIENFILLEIDNANIRENYRRKKTWQNFISKIMLGDSIDVISHLLKRAFPSTNHNLLLNKFCKVKDETNPTSHDNPGIRLDRLGIAKAIETILELTHKLISEMPWHFKPIQRNGNLPIVLTGNAWSHSYPNEKQISLILWDSNVSNGEFLVWNPDKKNPVMPNAKMVKRPSQ